MQEFKDGIIEDLNEEITQNNFKGARKTEIVLLLVRNFLALAAFIMFVICFVAECFHKNFFILHGIAYVFGAFAYFFEIIVETNCFREKVPADKMFMAYLFGPLYLLLALSYFLFH